MPEAVLGECVTDGVHSGEGSASSCCSCRCPWFEDLRAKRESLRGRAGLDIDALECASGLSRALLLPGLFALPSAAVSRLLVAALLNGLSLWEMHQTLSV